MGVTIVTIPSVKRRRLLRAAAVIAVIATLESWNPGREWVDSSPPGEFVPGHTGQRTVRGYHDLRPLAPQTLLPAGTFVWSVSSAYLRDLAEGRRGPTRHFL
jgi:hypothetical protein